MLDTTTYKGHTPGPWSFDDGITDDTVTPPHRGKPSYIAGPGDLALADVFYPEPRHRGGCPESIVECDANGRLMRDAPLLLAEVERLTAALEWEKSTVEKRDAQIKELQGEMAALKAAARECLDSRTLDGRELRPPARAVRGGAMTALQEARARLDRAIAAVVEACGGSEDTRMVLGGAGFAASMLAAVAMIELEVECGDTFASRQAKPLAEEYAAAVLALRKLEFEAMTATKGQTNG